MKLLLAIVIIAAISVVGSRLTFLHRRLPMGFRHIFLTGTEYIFIGVLLGGMGLNILDAAAQKQLEPFLIFGLCWVGFLFGLQFKVRQLKKFSRFFFSITATQAFITFLVVTVSIYFAFRSLASSLSISAAGVTGNGLFLIAVTLGSSASCTAQSAIAIVSRNYRFGNRLLLDLLRYISSVDGVLALCFFAVGLSIFPIQAAAGSETVVINLVGSLKWLFVTVIAGVIPALIFITISRSRFSQQELVVFLIGTVTFCGGFAYTLHHSPLVSGFVCGMVTANFSRHHMRALSTVLQAEKSIYIILLILLGAIWQFRLDDSLLITVIYFLMRVLGKVTGAFAATRIFDPGFDVPPSLGLGLLSEGGLAVAIIINFKMLFPASADPLITITVISVFVSEFIAPRFILGRFDQKKRLLPKSGQKIEEGRSAG